MEDFFGAEFKLLPCLADSNYRLWEKMLEYIHCLRSFLDYIKEKKEQRLNIRVRFLTGYPR